MCNALLKAAGAALAIASIATTARASTVITFDDLASGTLVSTQYSSENVLFGGDPTVLTSPDYNYTDYPPVSEPNVVYSPSDGFIDVMPGAGVFSSVGAYASVGSGPLTLTLYDAANNVIGTTSIGVSLGFSTFIGLSAAGIARAEFTGASDYFTLDNVTVSSVPEASTWTMVLVSFVGLGIVGASARRTRGATA